MSSNAGLKNFIRFMRKKGTCKTECWRKSNEATISLSQFGRVVVSTVTNMVVVQMVAFANRT